ncbi:MAG: CBS domain-containing protein, partial [Desulfofustis sp.]|nr:CBS domain-containing protein [Desulfofustis sp.]
MFVSQMMNTDLIAVQPGTKLAEARVLMQKNNFRHLPVVEQNDRLVGIITDRDMRDAHPSSLLDEEDYQRTLEKVMGHRVEEVMTKNPLTISVYSTLQDALMVIGKRKVGAL